MNVCKSQKRILRRFFMENGLGKGVRIGQSVSITGQDVKHIQRVLRLKPGDSIEGFDGEGLNYNCKISHITTNSIEVTVTSIEKSAADSKLLLTMAVGFLKEKKMDRLVRQLTELGVNQLIPFFADRSIPVLSEKRLDQRVLRWEKIAIESLKQCRRSRKMTITPATSFENMIQLSSAHDTKILFWEDATIPLSTILNDKKKHEQRILIIIGPEGGFADHEVKLAESLGCQLLSMGNRILRAETAVLFASSLVQYHYGDMGG